MENYILTYICVCVVGAVKANERLVVWDRWTGVTESCSVNFMFKFLYFGTKIQQWRREFLPSNQFGHSLGEKTEECIV